MINLEEDKVSNAAEKFYDRYRDRIDFFESNSQVGKLDSGVSAFDVAALGQQLEMYESYQKFCENRGSVSDLGELPSVALDVITASQAASIIPLIASVQPIQEESGIVYFKKVIATMTQGGFTEGQTISHAVDGTQNAISGSYGAGRQTVEVAKTAAGTKEYTGTVNTPVRPGSIEINVNGTVFKAFDKNGTLVGNGVYGTFNYQTGAFELKFAEEATADAAIVFNFDADVELQDDLPGISGGMDSTHINAEVFALKSETGLTELALAA